MSNKSILQNQQAKAIQQGLPANTLVIDVGTFKFPSFYIRNPVTGQFVMHGNSEASLPDGVTQEQLAEEYKENLHWLSFNGEGCDLAYGSNGKWTVVELLNGGGLQIHNSIEKGKSIIPDMIKKAGLVEVAKGVYAQQNNPRIAQLLSTDAWLIASPDERTKLASEALMGA